MNPDRALRKEAVAREWPVLVFARPVRLRDRFAGVSLPHPSTLAAVAVSAGAATAGVVWFATRRRGRGPAAAAACRAGDTPCIPAALSKEGLPTLPRDPVRALDLWVKHGSWAPTRRPAHVRAGEPG